MVFGLLLAWSLVRYNFLVSRLLMLLIDLPFALPTAVAGITLSALYAKNGWIGSLLEPYGIKIAFTPLGILVAITLSVCHFVMLADSIRVADLSVEFEEAAATLGANRWQAFRHVVFPALFPSVLTGFALAFCACGWWVRFGYFYCGQCADGIRNYAAINHYAFGTI